MRHTTHGLMTPADLADHQKLTDTAPHPDCPGHYAEPEALAYCSVADHCPGDEWEAGWVQAYDLQMPAPRRTPEPLTLQGRMDNYRRQTRRDLTPRQRRRVVKKAGRDPRNLVTRDDGMGYPPSMQGYRGLCPLPVPVSGGPY